MNIDLSSLITNSSSPKFDGAFITGNRPDTLWKVAAPYKVGQKLPMRVLYPRPDGETQTYSLHRKANTNWQYECRVCIQGGEPPFRHQIISGPAGATITMDFTRSVDSVTGLTIFSLPNGYATVKWPNPSGTANFVVRVTDQSDNTIDVTWSTTTDDTAFVVLDSVNGNDANAGTYAAPKRTFVTGLWKNSKTDNSFAGKIAAFKTGTYPIYQATALTSAEVDLNVKPLSFIGIPGSTAILDTSQGHFYLNASNTSFRNLTIDGSMASTQQNVRVMQVSPPCANVHFSSMTFRNIGQGTVKDDNVSCIMFVNNYPSYHSNATFVDCVVESTTLVQFHAVFAIDGMLDENCTQLDANMPYANGSLTFAYKDDIKNLTVRFNRTTGPNATFNVPNQQQASGGAINQELCYNFLSTTTNDFEHGAVQWNLSASPTNAANTHCYRNTIVNDGFAITAQKNSGGENVTISANLYTAATLIVGSGGTVGSPANVNTAKANINVNGAISNSTVRTANLGKVGMEIAST